MFEQFLYLGTRISKAHEQKVKIDRPQVSSIDRVQTGRLILSPQKAGQKTVIHDNKLCIPRGSDLQHL